MSQTTEPSFKEYQLQCQSRVDEELDKILPRPGEIASTLHNAMRYSVFNGGKRIRPLLVYATVDALKGNVSQANPAACAVELIHAYSLIHDDLPAMDDDDLRRGKPTCHKEFDEASAILAGDALQALAFEHLADNNVLTPTTSTQLIATLAKSAGGYGMVAGQAIDLEAVDKNINLAHLETMHRHKTGAIILASVQMGAISAGLTNESEIAQLETYAQAIGLAFQVQDDILDIESDTNTLGKQQGADQLLNKPTYPSLMGLDEAKNKARLLHEEAISSIETFGSNACYLNALADYIINRKY